MPNVVRVGLPAVALFVVAIAVGPPALPPLPGQGRRDPEPAAPTSPEPGGDASEPAPAKPITPTPKTGAPAAGAATVTPGVRSPDVVTPPPSGPSVTQPAIGQVAEPPQPSSSAGPPPDPGGAPAIKGPGAAPSMDRPGEIDGNVEPEGPAPMRLPPPKRPPYSGTGLFIGAGVTFVVALAEQIVAHVLVKRRCIDPVARNAMMMDEPVVIDPENPPKSIGGNDEIGDIVSQCAPGVVPAIALRVHSDIGLLATIGMATAGGALRGRRDAWDGVFANRPHAEFVGLRAAGIALIGTGVVTWFSSGAASWGWLASCDTARCATRARLLNFTMRDVSALMAAAGGTLLAFSEVHRRATANYERDKVLSVGVGTLRGGGSVQVSGRF